MATYLFPQKQEKHAINSKQEKLLNTYICIIFHLDCLKVSYFPHLPPVINEPSSSFPSHTAYLKTYHPTIPYQI